MAKKGNQQNDRGPAGNTAPKTSPISIPTNKQQSGGGGGGGGLSAQVKAAGSVVTKQEATKIAESTGKSVAQVMAKAQDRGAALGSALVNQFNRGNLGANTSTLREPIPGFTTAVNQTQGTTRALQQLQPLAGLKLNPDTAYAGYSTTTPQGGSTTYNPIVLPRNMAGGGGAGGAGGGAGGGNGGGGGGNGKVKNDGTIDSIKSLFEQQMEAARTQIDELRNQQAETINGLTADFSTQLAASQQSADQRIAGLNDLMLQQQDQAASTQALLQQQAMAAENAYKEQLRQADALGRAYVPTLNPSAATASLGDERVTTRQGTNNSLSDLAIVSGLGTNLNPLAGLQLA